MIPFIRLTGIITVIFCFALGWFILQFTSRYPRTPLLQRPFRSLAQLGPTFIKFGQALSLRQDMLPQEYIEALQCLQDHVAPIPAEQALWEIERAFGRPNREMFSDIEPISFAWASIEQVHRARLLDGQAVVVKVGRPNIDREIERDERALLWLARVAASLSRRLRHYELVRIVEVISSNLRKEIDFWREARNIRCLLRPLRIGRPCTSPMLRMA